MSLIPKDSAPELRRIEKLMDAGQIQAALQAIETFEQQAPNTPEEQLVGKILKSKLLVKKGGFEEGLKLAESVCQESQTKGITLYIVDALIAWGEALLSSGKYEASLCKIEQGEQALLSLTQDRPREVPLRQATILQQKGMYFFWQNELEQALAYFERSLALGEELSHHPTIVNALLGIGNTYWQKGMLDQALETFTHSLTCSQEVGLNHYLAIALNNMGGTYREKGKYDRALEYCQQSQELSQKFGYRPVMASSLLNIGYTYGRIHELDRALEYIQQGLSLGKVLKHQPTVQRASSYLGFIYRLKGKLDQALEYSQQSLAMAKKLGNKRLIAVALLDIGDTYRLKGELVPALDLCQQVLPIYKELGNPFLVAITLDTMGTIYWQTGKLDQALEHLEQSLALYEKSDGLYAANPLYKLIAIAIDKDSLDQARQYLQRLQQLDAQTSHKFVNQAYRVGEALIMKISPRRRNLGKAEELLAQVVAEEVIFHELSIVALLNLCNLHLAELRTIEAPELLEEVKSLVTRLQEIARREHSHWWLVEAYVLQAKLALLELNISDARKLLDQAQLLAEEWGLQRLVMQISTEQDTLLSQLEQWQDFLDRKVSLVERAELAHLEAQVTRMIRRRVMKPPEEETPELLLIIKGDSGLSVFSHTFQPNHTIEEQLLAGFLTAINALGRDALATTTIERIKYTEYTLLLQSLDPFLLCYVFQGPSYFAVQKLNNFIGALKSSEQAWQTLTATINEGRVPRIGIIDEALEELVGEIFHPL